MSKEELEKAKFFFQLALESEQVIQQAYERLNTKIRHFFAVTSTLIPIVTGLGYFIVRETKVYLVFIPILLSLVFLLGAIGRGILLQKPTHILFVNPMKMINSHRKKSVKYIIEKSASTWSDTVAHNRNVINSKENGLTQMLIFIGAGLIMLAIAFLTLGITLMN